MKTLAGKLAVPCVLLIGLLASGQSLAQSAPLKFLGLDITPGAGLYLVTKDVNVRAGPKTSAKRIGSLRRGARVDVVGKAEGGAGWMAVRRDGKDYGFVYSPVMLPILDGSLEKEITGRVMIRGRPPCTYTIRYRGRTEIEDGRMTFADYEIEYRCASGGKALRFYAPMFITEVPYRLTNKPVFQINIDLLGMDDDPDNIFSTVFMYRRNKKLVAFDSVSKAAMGDRPRRTDRAALTVPEALTGAVEIAPTVWTKKVWSRLATLSD